MLELGEGIGVEEVTGAADDTDVDGCTELLIDVITLDTDLVDVETLDILALLDGATELQVDEVGATLVVDGGANELDVITWLDSCTEELGLALKMLELGETVRVDEVTGAVDDTDVEGCTELLIDVVTLENELVDVEMLEILAVLDGAKDLERVEVRATLVVGGGTNELDDLLVRTLEEVALLELEQYTDDVDVYSTGDDELTAEEELALTEEIWLALDVDELETRLGLLDGDAAVVVGLEDIEVLELDEYKYSDDDEYIADEEPTLSEVIALDSDTCIFEKKKHDKLDSEVNYYCSKANYY